MADDMQLIKQLEEEIGEKLNRVKLDDTWTIKCFTIDKNGNVIMLYLVRMNLDKIPLTITRFHHLTMLLLKENEISDISMLKELGNLNYLDLGYNQISDISMLKELGNLEYLDLRNNQISDISMLKDLGNLKILDLINNKISKLPEEILELPMEIKCEWHWEGEEGILLNGNPLKFPPSKLSSRVKRPLRTISNRWPGKSRT